ncbi:hypothetical protein GGR58DRAFT_507342 [Xylaria digitata]|nr:hypothetical protein GGR58DRAFT_507342 [Xylaria digitata]
MPPATSTQPSTGPWIKGSSHNLACPEYGPLQPSVGGLIHHKNNHHLPGEFMFGCRRCPEKFLSEETRRFHEEYDHTENTEVRDRNIEKYWDRFICPFEDCDLHCTKKNDCIGATSVPKTLHASHILIGISRQCTKKNDHISAMSVGKTLRESRICGYVEALPQTTAYRFYGYSEGHFITAFPIFDAFLRHEIDSGMAEADQLRWGRPLMTPLMRRYSEGGDEKMPTGNLWVDVRPLRGNFLHATARGHHFEDVYDYLN